MQTMTRRLLRRLPWWLALTALVSACGYGAPYRTVQDLAEDDDLSPVDLTRVAARANNVGEWDLALRSVERALETAGLDPGELVDAAFARANALVKLGRLPEAEPAFQEFRKLYDSTPRGHSVDMMMMTGLQSELDSLQAESH